MAIEAGKPLPARLVGVSLKMYFDYPRTAEYIRDLCQACKNVKPVCGIFVIPSFPALVPANAAMQQTPNLSLGAQDCHWEDSGAFTGEVAPLLLKQVGCTMVELGHAERRRAPLNEDDTLIGKKAQAAARNGLVPLVCIGEKSQSKIASEAVGLAMRECLPQMTAVLNAIPPEASLIFAYEPVWAIGAQEPASSDHVCTVVKQLRSAIQQRARTGEVKILYGGSAGPGTWATLKEDLDGLFLGRFAHNIDALKKVVDEVER